METVTVNGITYNVESKVTREDIRESQPLTYRNMTKTGQIAYLNLRRPAGRKVCIGIEFSDGNIKLL